MMEPREMSTLAKATGLSGTSPLCTAYSSTAWSPHQIGIKKNLEMVQRKAARMFFKHFTGMNRMIVSQTVQPMRAPMVTKSPTIYDAHPCYEMRTQISEIHGVWVILITFF